MSDMIGLSAVSYFEGVEELYYKLRQEQWVEALPSEPLEVGRRTLVKKKICKRILTSHFSEMHSIDWVDVELQIICQELQNDESEIFFSIFDEYEFKTRFCLFNQGISYEYQNRYKLCRVRTHEGIDGDEYCFMCIGRDKTTGKLKEYFVSQPYNVNEIPSAIPIAGRFIFSFNNSGGTLELIALAEQAAFHANFLRITKVTPLIYEQTRRSEKLADSPDLDPICSLSAANKLRLCVSIFGSRKMKKKFKFSPVLDSVQLNCEKKSLKITCSGYFEEWVIGCKAMKRKNDKQTILYISRGIFQNTVFLYVTLAGQRISVYNYCLQVPVANRMATLQDNADMQDIIMNLQTMLDEYIELFADEERRNFRDDVED